MDADLDEAVLGCIASAFGYQGQKCSALSRLIVVADNYAKVLDRLIAAADSMRVGPAEIPGTIMARSLTVMRNQRIMAIIESGKQEAKLAWQGTVPNDPNACYVPPTIFTEVAPDSRLFEKRFSGRCCR